MKRAVFLKVVHITCTVIIAALSVLFTAQFCRSAADSVRTLGTDAAGAVIQAGIILAAELAAIFAATLITTFIRTFVSRKDLDAAYRELLFLNHNLPGGVQKCSAAEPYTIEYMSDGFLRLVGCTAEELCHRRGACMIDTVYEPDRESVRRSLSDFLLSGGDGILKIRYRIITRSGAPVWVSNRARLITEGGESFFYSIIVDISETKKAEDALRMSLEQYRIAVAQVENVVFEYYPQSKLIIRADAKDDRFGMQRRITDAPMTLVEHNVVLPESADELQRVFSEIDSGASGATADIRVRMETGSEAWMKLSMHSIYSDEKKVVKAVGVLVDITREKLAEQRLRKEENYRTAIFSETLFAFEYDIASTRITAKFDTGHQTSPFLDFDKYFPLDKHTRMIHPEDIAVFRRELCPDSLWSAYRRGADEISVDIRLFDASGEWRWVEIISHFLNFDSELDVRCVVYIKDIDSRKRGELALKNKAERDPLTGVLNRTAAEERICCLLSQTDCLQGARHAFMVLDLDCFKSVNDEHGHIAGDRYLVNVTAAISAAFRSTDIIGRLGGDEFIVFMKDIRTSERAAAKADELCRTVSGINLSEPGEAPAFSSISVGISIAPDDGVTFQDLYCRADRALYRAKENGRNCYSVSR